MSSSSPENAISARKKPPPPPIHNSVRWLRASSDVSGAEGVAEDVPLAKAEALGLAVELTALREIRRSRVLHGTTSCSLARGGVMIGPKPRSRAVDVIFAHASDDRGADAHHLLPDATAATGDWLDRKPVPGSLGRDREVSSAGRVAATCKRWTPSRTEGRAPPPASARTVPVTSIGALLRRMPVSGAKTSGARSSFPHPLDRWPDPSLGARVDLPLIARASQPRSVTALRRPCAPMSRPGMPSPGQPIPDRRPFSHVRLRDAADAPGYDPPRGGETPCSRLHPELRTVTRSAPRCAGFREEGAPPRVRGDGSAPRPSRWTCSASSVFASASRGGLFPRSTAHRPATWWMRWLLIEEDRP